MIPETCKSKPEIKTDAQLDDWWDLDLYVNAICPFQIIN